MISDTISPRAEQLPDWFKDKWQCINFREAVDYWVSYTEYKMYGQWIGFVTDVQKVLNELEWPDYRTIQLVFIADERQFGHPDVIHVEVFKDKIIESHAEWNSHEWDEEDYKNDKGF
jgi:hypothetical protein